MPSLDNEGIIVMATPGIGLTLTCLECHPHVDIFNDPYDAKWDDLKKIVLQHRTEKHGFI